MQLTLEDFYLLEQFRSLKNTSRVRLMKQVNNPLLVTRFRRFIVRHKPNDSLDVTTPKRF
jgi:hypothetical protein